MPARPLAGSIAALVLAGRRNENDPLLSAADAPATKALLQVAGRSMIDRVLGALGAAKGVGAITVSGLSQRDLPQGVAPAPDADSPAAAILAAGADSYPLLVTTCDHALLSKEIVDAFVDQAMARDADLAVGFASRTVVEASYPGVARTYLTLGGEGYSGCNLFLIRTPKGFDAIRFWRTMEQDRKRPFTLARRIGPGLLLRYLFRSWTSLEGVFAYGSRRLGVRLNPVLLPFADAAVDVDKPSDLALVERVLADRG